MSEDGRGWDSSPSVPVMETTDTRLDWPHLALEQLTWHWEGHLRPRLEGLADAEYHWEPAAGGGDWTCDFGIPGPVPAPVTTIAWRIAHLVVGVFGARAASHFGAPATSYETHPYAGTADEALAQLDATYVAWRDGVRSLAPEDWARPVGPAEGAWAAGSTEVALLRDLWARERPTAV